MPAGAEPKPLQAARLGARALLTLGVWTLWLALALLLAAQLYVASTDELSLPGFVRRALEARLAASGISATFGRTYFDPTGRIVVENLALTLPDTPSRRSPPGRSPDGSTPGSSWATGLSRSNCG